MTIRKDGYSTGEVAEMLGLTSKVAVKLANSGSLECTKTGRGHRRFSKDHILRFMRKNGYKKDWINLGGTNKVVILGLPHFTGAISSYLLNELPVGVCVFQCPSTFELGYRFSYNIPLVLVVDFQDSSEATKRMLNYMKTQPELCGITRIALIGSKGVQTSLARMPKLDEEIYSPHYGIDSKLAAQVESHLIFEPESYHHDS